MIIGIIYDDISRPGLDCRNPQKGNPGVGGTQFCYLMFMYYYTISFPEDKIIVYRHRQVNEYPKMPLEDKITYKKVDSVEKCIEMASLDHVDVLLFTHNHVAALNEKITEYKIKCIVWIHNWIRGSILDLLSNNPSIRKVVFLVNEHYDRYIDHDVIKKGVIIPNMLETKGLATRDDCKQMNVTYVGAVVPGKGFDVLAKAWPKVIAEVPDAHLFVIGKGNLYGNISSFGPLGIAEESFEKKFAKYLLDDANRVLPSVHFMGLLGGEKMNIFKKTKVGVVNPSGRTEVCPISALEMEAFEIPVVSKSTNGIPDVIVNQKTGLLVHSEREIAASIIKLLKDNEMNSSYGAAARVFVENSFNPHRIIKLWHELFIRVQNGEEEKVHVNKTLLQNDFKWIRQLNYYLKKTVLFRWLPSMINVESMISKALHGR